MAKLLETMTVQCCIPSQFGWCSGTSHDVQPPDHSTTSSAPPLVAASRRRLKKKMTNKNAALHRGQPTSINLQALTPSCSSYAHVS
jgi:hypothetical protein